MDIKQTLAAEFNINQEYISNIVDLISDGNTIPFIARYRKEMHGACDDQVIREIADRLNYLNNLTARKLEVEASIQAQEKWTDELKKALEAAKTMTEVEDIYRPYKQKKKTRASVAIEKGLEPLADIIMAQELKDCEIMALATEYLNEEKGVLNIKDAIDGAKDIIAERISDDANLRKTLRQLLYDIAVLECKLDIKEKKDKKEDKKEDKKSVYEMYADYSEKLSTIPSHRILAVNRGEKEEYLKVNIRIDEQAATDKIKMAFKKDSAFNTIMDETISDSYQRLIFPSIEREVRNELFETASEQAIKMFEVNLKPLLLQPPLKGKVILGLDPAYRTGCKIAVIDSNGNVLDNTVIYPTPPQSKTEEAKATLKKLIEKHKVDIISIGNGTASKESEIFVVDLIKECDRPINYMVVNEAGASVYSASKLGAEEFPEYDLTARSAISIARRLQDPLAELIKIDVKSIGVGQYQHDMPQKRLTEVLTGVVESCVNNVGVDLNTASYSLLSYVSGLNTSIAKNIVEYRKKQPFKTRRQLTEVAKLGPKAFEQCAGFLRIPGGENLLDNTSVHPEAYEAATKLLAKFGYTDENLRQGKITDIKDKILESGAKKVAESIGIGEPTLNDIVEEILKPGRDIRDSLPPPILRADLLDIKDLVEGMDLTGTIRNVIDFGAFVDIGVHHDGLVHISEISDKFIKHPSEALTVGETVRVRVIGVDAAKQRINLSIRAADSVNTENKDGKEKMAKKPFVKNDNFKPNLNNRSFNDNRSNGNNRNNEPVKQEKEKSLDEMLDLLTSKFNKRK